MDYRRRCFTQVIVLASAATYWSLRKEEQRRQIGGRPPAIIRQRRSVSDVYQCLGDNYFRRAYRMSYDSFWVLHSKIENEIKNEIENRRRKAGGSFDPRHAPPVPNGPISTSVRLAVAIRYFAGGSPYVLCSVYGNSHSSVQESVWIVVDAINSHKDMDIVYPSSHEEQQKIATGFQEKSMANFDVCAGAIDGILIWIHKPSPADCRQLKVGQAKFFCGRKKKFGLNCHAVCDARGRFLDISICLGGASSDCLAFERSSLFQKLEDGILADGLCLFGDNAYLNKSYMASPYVNCSRQQDNYKYYHSQVRLVCSQNGGQSCGLLCQRELQYTNQFVWYKHLRDCTVFVLT
jgi:hypothetical protein